MASPRKLASKTSAEKTVTFSSLPCVSGGWLKQPRAVDVVDVDGKGEFVRVVCTTTWLHEVISGNKSNPKARQVLMTVLGDLKTAVSTAQEFKADGLALT